jgi:integrase
MLMQITPTAPFPEVAYSCPEELQGYPLSKAGKYWLTEHSRYIKPRTIKDYRQYLDTLIVGMHDPILKDIHIGVIRLYQQERSARACNARINMELSALQQILKEAKLWQNVADFYRPLPISMRGAGRSVSKEDQQRLLDIAFSNPRRRLAAHCIRIMLRCGVGFGELSQVRRRDVDLKERRFEIVGGAKNRDRERPIPMGDQAYDSMQWIILRYESLGGNSGEDYILPHCSSRSNGPRDFGRPMGSIKTAWKAIRKEAARSIGPHMTKFRLYDCRVTAVTKALASGKVSIHTAEKLFGHVSQAMQRRYYKPTMKVLQEAVDVLEDKETLSALNTYTNAASEPQSIREAAFSLAEKANAAMGGISVAALIKRMQRSGMTPEAILGILTDDEAASHG